MKKDDFAQYLLQALVNIQKACEGLQIKPGIVDNIAGLVFLVQKIRKHGEPKTIGFFGAQKRGKSSLINQLLKIDLLPVSPIPMSAVAITIQHDESHAKDSYTIDINNADGTLNITRNISLDHAQLLLKTYGSHKGNMSEDVDYIVITSNFSDSKILENGGVLIDTPGAEVVFNEDSKKQDENNSNDAKRALNILSQTHIVIFVERADYLQSENSKQLFTENLKPLRPMCVINFKDSFSLDDADNITDSVIIEAKKQNKMREKMLQAYSINLDRTFCVSSKEAADAIKNNDMDLLAKSNLPILEDRILNELQNLDPEKGLITCLQELKKILSQIDKETVNKIFPPAKRALSVFIEKSSKNTVFQKATSLARGVYEKYN